MAIVEVSTVDHHIGPGIPDGGGPENAFAMERPQVGEGATIVWFECHQATCGQASRKELVRHMEMHDILIAFKFTDGFVELVLVSKNSHELPEPGVADGGG